MACILRSFQPTLETLESRQLMDAGFGGAVLPSLVAPHDLGGPIAGQMGHGMSAPVSAAWGQQGHAQSLPGAVQQSQFDVPKLVAEWAARRFGDVIGAGRFGNIWMLQRVKSMSGWWIDKGNRQLGVTINFTYGLTTDGNHGYVDLLFYDVKVVGTTIEFKYARQLSRDYKGGFQAALKTRIDEVYRGAPGKVQLVDFQRFALSVSAQSIQFMDNLGYRPISEQPELSFEAVDGGVRMRLKMQGGLGGYQFDALLKFNWDQQRFECVSMEVTRLSGWRPGYTDDKLKNDAAALQAYLAVISV